MPSEDRVTPNEKGVEEEVLGSMMLGGAEPIAVARDAGQHTASNYADLSRSHISG